MTILNTKSIIKKHQDKTNIAIPFSVDKPCKMLQIKYSYSPKIIEGNQGKIQAEECLKKYNISTNNAEGFLPVKNLVTLSFDSPDGYIGACHRQASNQSIIIAPSNSTYGICNTPITCGQWQIMLNVHYAGCDIEYELQVCGVEE